MSGERRCMARLLEIQRLPSKIAGLAEMAINRQDPEMITLEVDGVSESVAQTEQTMRSIPVRPRTRSRHVGCALVGIERGTWSTLAS